MRQMKLLPTLTFEDSGNIDRDLIESYVRNIIDRARLDGAITPDDDDEDHAALDDVELDLA
jgi:hypothetical protein